MHYDGSSEDSSEDLKQQDDLSKEEAEGHTPLVKRLEKLAV